MLNLYEIDPEIIRTSATRINRNHYKPAPDGGKAFMTKYGISKPYFFMGTYYYIVTLLVGDRTGGKNLQIFFHAVSLLRDDERAKFSVVVTGGGDFSEGNCGHLSLTFLQVKEPCCVAPRLTTLVMVHCSNFCLQFPSTL